MAEKKKNAYKDFAKNTAEFGKNIKKINVNTALKNARIHQASGGEMGMTKTQFVDKYGMTPTQVINRYGK